MFHHLGGNCCCWNCLPPASPSRPSKVIGPIELSEETKAVITKLVKGMNSMTTPTDKIQVTADGVTYEPRAVLAEFPWEGYFFWNDCLCKWEITTLRYFGSSVPNPAGGWFDYGAELSGAKQAWKDGCLFAALPVEPKAPEWVEVSSLVPTHPNPGFFTIHYQAEITKATTRILAPQRVKIEWPVCGTIEYEKQKDRTWDYDNWFAPPDSFEALVRTALRDGVKVWVMEGVAS